MKKNQKRIAVNNQEDEDFEVYILYPENATENTNREKAQQKQNDGYKTASKDKELHNSISTNQSYSGSK